jgi:hypothetical protein
MLPLNGPLTTLLAENMMKKLFPLLAILLIHQISFGQSLFKENLKSIQKKRIHPVVVFEGHESISTRLLFNEKDVLTEIETLFRQNEIRYTREFETEDVVFMVRLSGIVDQMGRISYSINVELSLFGYFVAPFKTPFENQMFMSVIGIYNNSMIGTSSSNNYDQIRKNISNQIGYFMSDYLYVRQ